MSPETDSPNWRRQLEAEARAGREALAELNATRQAQAELEAARRELAMRRAGVDPDSPRARYFVKGYEGPLDPDAIRTEAYEAGILGPSGGGIPLEQQYAMQQIQNARAGGMAGGAGVDFEGELDSIPMYVRGADGHMEQNPAYLEQVLEATQRQAAREGRQFVTSAGHVSPQQGQADLGKPATTPLSE